MQVLVASRLRVAPRTPSWSLLHGVHRWSLLVSFRHHTLRTPMPGGLSVRMCVQVGVRSYCSPRRKRRQPQQQLSQQPPQQYLGPPPHQTRARAATHGPGPASPADEVSPANEGLASWLASSSIFARGVWRKGQELIKCTPTALVVLAKAGKFARVTSALGARRA